MEDFPAPVAPTMTMCGKGRSEGGSSGVPKYETTLNKYFHNLLKKTITLFYPTKPIVI